MELRARAGELLDLFPFDFPVLVRVELGEPLGIARELLGRDDAVRIGIEPLEEPVTDSRLAALAGLLTCRSRSRSGELRVRGRTSRWSGASRAGPVRWACSVRPGASSLEPSLGASTRARHRGTRSACSALVQSTEVAHAFREFLAVEHAILVSIPTIEDLLDALLAGFLRRRGGRRRLKHRGALHDHD